MSRQRNLSMDLLRVIACLMVVAVHANSSWKYFPIDSPQWRATIGYESFVRSAVLLFFMISGAFGRSTDIKKGVQKAFHYIIVFFLISLFYSVDDAILELTYGRRTSISTILNGIVDYKYHLWFLPTFVFLTFISPFINRLFNSDKGKKVIYGYLIIWIIFGVILRTAQLDTAGIDRFGIIGSSLEKLSFVPILSENPIGCYCLGRIFMERRRSAGKNLGLFMLGILSSIISLVLTVIYSTKLGSFDARFMHDTTVFILIQGIAWFCFVSGLSVSPSLSGLLEKIVPHTFGIYLIHVFFVDWLSRIKVFGEVNFCGIGIHPIVQVPLRLLTVFILSFLSLQLLSKIKSKDDH